MYITLCVLPYVCVVIMNERSSSGISRETTKVPNSNTNTNAGKKTYCKCDAAYHGGSTKNQAERETKPEPIPVPIPVLVPALIPIPNPKPQQLFAHFVYVGCSAASYAFFSSNLACFKPTSVKTKNWKSFGFF